MLSTRPVADILLLFDVVHTRLIEATHTHNTHQHTKPFTQNGFIVARLLGILSKFIKVGQLEKTHHTDDVWLQSLEHSVQTIETFYCPCLWSLFNKSRFYVTANNYFWSFVGKLKRKDLDD